MPSPAGSKETVTLWAPQTVGAEDRCAPGTPLSGRKDLVGLWGQKEGSRRGAGPAVLPLRGALSYGARSFGWRLPDHLPGTFLRELLLQAEAG